MVIAVFAGAWAGCVGARTAADVGLFASGVAGIGAARAVMEGEGHWSGDAALAVGWAGAGASAVTGAALAARCGRGRWGVMSAGGTAMTALGAPLLVLGGRGWSGNVRAGTDLEGQWVMMVGYGVGLTTAGAVLNRVGWYRLRVAPIPAGGTVVTGVVGRW